MSPGVNDGPRSTGTVPKSNRRNDRNRERSAANQIANRSTYHGHAQHSNNLFQLDWKPVGECEQPRIAKNSNTRSVSSAPSTSYQDIPEFASHSCGRQYNYSTEEFTHWQKMVPPTDSRTQSPPHLQGTKPSNVDKMPDRIQVETRLNQIRDYIRVTSTMMDSLNQSSDPRAQAQNEKLSRMVEDLHDSERKLHKLLEQYQNSGIFDENGDLDENGEGSTKAQLQKKMEESQRKLAQLQEQQANLVGMQLRVREKLNEARQAQQILLQQENQVASTAPLPIPANIEQLESKTAALRGVLAQLQTKKKHMNHLVAELQAVEMAVDRSSSSPEGSRNFGRDKSAELEAMKAQLVHLKALMDEVTRARESVDSTSEPEPDNGDMNGEAAEDVEVNDEENETNISFERQSDSDEIGLGKIRNTGDRPTVEEIQAVTRELREQSVLLQTTRAELQRLKQPLTSSAIHSNSASMFSTSTPPPSLTASIGSEKKQSNNASVESLPIQDKRRQLEDLMRKESSQASSINRDVGGPEANSHRSSSSQISHTSTPANIWPPPTVVGGSNEQSVDGISTSENLLDIGPQTNAIENGMNGNWWAYPPPPLNQVQHGSAEYYRQLLLGSQAQQLQMMGTTIQQCCQLLWSQQRELQSMRAAITQLQMQLRQAQAPQRANNVENHEEYSNLSRSVHHLSETLDAALPPSSSLPNLVSLPNSSPALSHAAAVTSTNSQQNQQQQLNNQVPPGNRANNYWDNFRSYSRQNLLSGNVKTMTDTGTGAIANSVSAANTSGSSTNSTHIKDKRNREQGADNLPLPSLIGAETQYSLNLMNILTNEMSQQQVDNLWEEAHSSFRLPSAVIDAVNPLLNVTISEMKEVLVSLISANRRRPNYLLTVLRDITAISEDHRLRPHLLKSLRALQDTQSLSNPLNEATDQTASESCQSSDEDSEVGFVFTIGRENQSSAAEAPTSSQAGASSSPTAQAPLMDHVEVQGAFSLDCASALPSTSSIKPGYNEDLAEADQSRPESSGNQQLTNNEEENDQGQEEAAGHTASAQSTFEVDVDLESLAKAEDERAEDTVLDKIPIKLYHH